MANIGTKIVENKYLEDCILNNKEEYLYTLIIGECNGGENVIQTVMKDGKCHDIECIDILPLKKGSPLHEIILEENDRISFKQLDFVKGTIENKYDFIVCISVLEHFGMHWDGEKMFSESENPEYDKILWDYDLMGIRRMGELLVNNGEAIITLPIGPYMNYSKNGLPFLRYYDSLRRDIILSEIDKMGCKIINEKFYHSTNYVSWDEVTKEVFDPRANGYISSYTPNAIWAFTIKK